MLVSGSSTNEGGQEIIVGVTVSNPLGGTRCTRSTGIGLTVNRGRKWKIRVVDLVDTISVRDRNLARGG